MTLLDTIKFFFYDPVVKAEYSKNEVLTLTHKSGKLQKYHGECTVWSYYPDMDDVGTMGEERLHRYWKLCRHSNTGIWIKS